MAIDAWRAFRSPDPAELLDLTLRLSAARAAVSSGVLACRANHIGLNRIDVWRGGVRPAGSDGRLWRWDAQGETLVS